MGIAHVRKPCPSKELGLIPNPNNSLSEDGIRYIPIEVIDVAGLVPGAHEGKGWAISFLTTLGKQMYLFMSWILLAKRI